MDIARIAIKPPKCLEKRRQAYYVLGVGGGGPLTKVIHLRLFCTFPFA